jgi:hypothetical protein
MDDPLEGMANLFDVAMVFALALMVALVSRYQMTEMLTAEDFTMVKNPGQANMEIITKKGSEITRYAAGDSTSDSRGRGRRVGVAYQLESGEIVYVPESAAAPPPRE